MRPERFTYAPTSPEYLEENDANEDCSADPKAERELRSSSNGADGQGEQVSRGEARP